MSHTSNKTMVNKPSNAPLAIPNLLNSNNFEIISIPILRNGNDCKSETNSVMYHLQHYF